MSSKRLIARREGRPTCDHTMSAGLAGLARATQVKVYTFLDDLGQGPCAEGDGLKERAWS